MPDTALNGYDFEVFDDEDIEVNKRRKIPSRISAYRVRIEPTTLGKISQQ